MSESNVPEIIKYLTEENLKLMYSRLNRRYLVVDALPSVDSLEPADKNVIYVVKETVGETVRYWPNVLDNDVWKPFGIGQADLDGKADKVDAVEGHLVVADKDGNLVDADILPGTFVALAIDPSESIQPHATDLRKIWKAYQSGMPVTLLDNRPDGSGLYAHLNAAGYTWVDGNRMAEYLDAVDDDNRQCDGTIHGYRVEHDGVVKFYEDDEHTVEIAPENGKLYCDDTVPDHDRVYLYNDGFVRALRFVQFSCNELIDDDPAWPSRRATRQVFYRMTEPYGSSSPDGFEVAYGESTADIHDQMVTGARIGDGKLLPVDDGVIVLPKSTAVNDGTLTITVGESEPVVFSANDSADRAVDIPVATDEVAGLVRITSDVDSDDPDVAITATAVLNKLDSYVQKVDGATTGHIAVFTSEGSMSDSGISSTDVESAVGHDHTHVNKSILDEVTAPYTTDEQAKLAGIEAGAQLNVIETVKVDGTALTVTDKAVDIDMSDKADKVPGATSGNFAALDASGNLTDSGYKAADFATAEQGTKADAAYQKPDDGIPKSDLDSSVQASLDKADTALQEHQDISGKVDKVEGKGLSTNDFTDNDKNKLDGIASGAQVNVIESITAGGTALPISEKTVNISVMTGATAQASGTIGLVPQPLSADVDKFLRGDGTWQVASMNEAPESDIDELFDIAGTVRIGGRLYRTITMDNQEWLAENLDYKFEYNGEPLPVNGSGTPSTPAAWYYARNEESYGIDGTYKCGLLYNGYAVDYLEANKATLLPSGWHVPSKSEWETMQEHIGGSSVGGTKLKAIPGSLDGNWPSESWGGTDDYEFTAYPGGEMWGGDFHDIGVAAQFWTTTVKTGSYVWGYMLLETSPAVGEIASQKTFANSIRLVKTLS